MNERDAIPSRGRAYNAGTTTNFQSRVVCIVSVREGSMEGGLERLLAHLHLDHG